MAHTCTRNCAHMYSYTHERRHTNVATRSWLRPSARFSACVCVCMCVCCAQLAAKRQQLGEERYRKSKYDLAGKLIAGTIQVGA